jgi:diguanylate cyclase (GGDEF)-like protein
MKTRILIVEDEETAAGTLREYLDIVGYESLVANTPGEAIKALNTGNIDMVIIDIKLGGMDGLDLTAEVKKEHNVDVIVMTGYSEEYSYESVINKGASDLIFKPIHFEELVLRIKRVLRERQLSQGQIEMMRKLKKLAITDGLTKLFNSRHFYNQLELEVDRSNRYAHALALLLLDIDNFKKYNDTYGHLEGDKVLVRLGQAIHTCLRSMDSAYRYGGEEFTVILPETKGEEALAVAERIRTVVENENFSPRSDTKAPITISLGVTEFYPKEKIETFVKRADEAMYLSKDQGRNRVSSLFKN